MKCKFKQWKLEVPNLTLYFPDVIKMDFSSTDDLHPPPCLSVTPSIHWHYHDNVNIVCTLQNANDL